MGDDLIEETRDRFNVTSVVITPVMTDGSPPVTAPGSKERRSRG